MRRKALPTLVVALTGLCAAAPAHAGKLVTIDAPTKLVDTTTVPGTVTRGPRPLKANVLLPGGYSAKSKRRYPVLWLLHGAAGTYSDWTKNVKVTDVAKGLDAIVVMPDGGRFGMYSDWWDGGRRSGPRWSTYLLTEVRRPITKRYRIRAGRRWHAVAGISMGGQGTLRLASLLPGYFGSAAALSPAVPDTQALVAELGVPLLATGAGAGGVSADTIWGPTHGFYRAGTSPQRLVENLSHTRLYVTSGNGLNCAGDPVNLGSIPIDILTEFGLHGQQGAYAAAARKAGASVLSRETCGVHTFGVWNRAFDDIRKRWGFFGAVEEHPAVWNYTTAMGAGEAWGLRYRTTAPPTTLLRFSRSGKNLRGWGSGTVAFDGGKKCRFTVTLPFSRTLPKKCPR